MGKRNSIIIMSLIMFLITIVFKIVGVEYECIVDDHDVPLPTSGAYYNCTGGDRGFMNADYVNYTWDNKSDYTATIINPQGSWTWAGMWYSLIHINKDNIPLDFKAIFGPYIKPEYQGEVIAVGIVVSNIQSPLNNGNLELRIELKDRNDVLTSSTSWKNPIPGEYMWNLPEEAKAKVKMITWILDYAQLGDSITIDKVLIKVKVPDLPVEKEAFLWSYSWLISDFDSDTGMVQDRSNFKFCDYENVSASAKAAKLTYYAYKLGFIIYEDAVNVITKIADTLIHVVPRGPCGVNRIWPHFTLYGGKAIVHCTEWSTGDTFFAALDLITTLQLLNDPKKQMEDVNQFLKEINWQDLVMADGAISHGYTSGGVKILDTWRGFGMETMGVNWAYASATTITKEMMFMEPPPTDNGSGFIDNACYPMIFSGFDFWGNNWDNYRSQAATNQIGWYTQEINPFIHEAGLFGLSAAEVPNIQFQPQTNYIAYGVGGKYHGPEDGNGEVIVLHYSAMISDIRIENVSHVWEILRGGIEPRPEFLKKKIILSPLNNMESMSVNKETGEIIVNHLKGSWNLALQAEGWAMNNPDIKNELLDAIKNNDFLRRGYELLKLSPTQTWMMY